MPLVVGRHARFPRRVRPGLRQGRARVRGRRDRQLLGQPVAAPHGRPLGLDAPKCSYKTEGDQRDKTTYVMEFGRRAAASKSTARRDSSTPTSSQSPGASRRRREYDDRRDRAAALRGARRKDHGPRRERGPARALRRGRRGRRGRSPDRWPCDAPSANDARSGGGDGVRARATALTDDLAENFEDPEAIQLTTYQPRPQSRAAS